MVCLSTKNISCSYLDVCFVAISALSSAAFGQGIGDILLDELRCTGDESRLVDCPHNGIGIHNCRHSEDAGLVCKGEC